MGCAECSSPQVSTCTVCPVHLLYVSLFLLSKFVCLFVCMLHSSDVHVSPGQLRWLYERCFRCLKTLCVCVNSR